ncbi:MAG: hypothetical protein ACHQUC_08950 [Chlamydiales bacterium]
MRLINILVLVFAAFFSCAAEPVKLDPMPKPIAARPIKPEIAVNNAGSAAMIWETFSKEIYVVAGFDQEWPEPYLIARGESPKITIDRSGNAVAVWISHRTIQAAVFDANLRSWSTPTTVVKREAQLTDLKLAGNANGTVAALWIEQISGQPLRVFSVLLSKSGGEWSKPEALSDGENPATLPAIAMNAEGLILAAWEENMGAISVVKYTQCTKDQTWAPPLQISSTDRHAICPSVAIDDHGNGILLWVRHHSEMPAVVEAAMLPADGSWIHPMDLGLTDLTSYPKLVMNGNGYAAAIWSGDDHPFICFSSVQFGSAWSTVIEIPKSLSWFTGLAISPSGRVVVVWKNFFRKEGRDYNSIESAIIPSHGEWIRLFQIIKPQVIDSVPFPINKLDHPQVGLDGTTHGYIVWGTARFPFIQISDF